MSPHSKSRSPIAQQIYQALATYLRRESTSFQPGDSLRDDLGLDSLMTIELLYEIENVFDLQIPDEDFSGLVTIGDVITYIENKKHPRSSRHPTKPQSSTAKTKAASGQSKSAPPAPKHR